MKLNLLILLFTGVASATQNITGSGVTAIESEEFVTEDLSSRELAPAGMEPTGYTCNSICMLNILKCNTNCRTNKRTGKTRCIKGGHLPKKCKKCCSGTGGPGPTSCDTGIKVLTVVTDEGRQNKISRTSSSSKALLRYIKKNFSKPNKIKKMRDFEVIEVGGQKTQKRGGIEIGGDFVLECSNCDNCCNFDFTDDDDDNNNNGTTLQSLLIIIVMSLSQFNSSSGEIKKLPKKMVKDLKCSGIRSLRNRSAGLGNYLMINCGGGSCTTKKMLKAVELT